MSRRLRIAFAAASVLCLVVLAVSPFKDYFSEWRRYQHAYNRLVADLPQRVKPVEIGIRQIWNQKLDRIDRCVTCHLGLNDNALRNAPQPFRTHPRIHHDIQAFGCTICHEGQGAATETGEAHGFVKFWDRPILPRRYLDASCAKCHKEQEVPESPDVNLGRRLLRESNCAGCHKLEGYEKQWIPSLDGIGSKVSRSWIVRWLKNPSAYSAGTRMPNFLLSDAEAQMLADFLFSFKKFPGDARLDSLPPIDEKEKAQLVELGSVRFREARCISCHAVNGKGGTGAPDLGKIASKAQPSWLFAYIRDPKRLQPGVLMPRYGFTDREVRGVTAYFESEFVDYDQPPDSAHAVDPDFYEKGLTLFRKYNCGGCHSLAGISRAEEMAPDLSAIGGKKIYEIEFGRTSIERTLPSYLRAKLLHPRMFSPAMKMPDFGFTRREADAIATALLGNGSERIPEDMQIRPSPPSAFAPQGEFGRIVNTYACFGCHVMNGRGKLVATDLSQEASAARREWIAAYFKVPYSLRPVLTVRMPNLSLTDAEIKTIVDYFGTSFIADSLEHAPQQSPADAAAGKTLYFERYGCQSCHQIGSAGGYVGPPLDKVGSRLKPGWIFAWLKNPQALRSGAIEPNNHLTDAEAQALTAWLMSLK